MVVYDWSDVTLRGLDRRQHRCWLLLGNAFIGSIGGDIEELPRMWKYCKLRDWDKPHCRVRIYDKQHSHIIFEYDNVDIAIQSLKGLGYIP
jgi:hypothetical protein